MWVVGCLLPHCAYTTCLPFVNTLRTCVPEHSNKVESEIACSQWVLQGMADGILGGKRLLDR